MKGCWHGMTPITLLGQASWCHTLGAGAVISKKIRLAGLLSSALSASPWTCTARAFVAAIPRKTAH